MASSSRFLHMTAKPAVIHLASQTSTHINREALFADRSRLSGPLASHLWPFQEWVETDRACYLIRQYVFSNLYHRLSMRPFMSHIEKVCVLRPASCSALQVDAACCMC